VSAIMYGGCVRDAPGASGCSFFNVWRGKLKRPLRKQALTEGGRCGGLGLPE
jgi:hypothetical protein